MHYDDVKASEGNTSNERFRANPNGGRNMIEYAKCECWGTHTSRKESSGRYVVRLMSRGDANLRAIRGSTCALAITPPPQSQISKYCAAISQLTRGLRRDTGIIFVAAIAGFDT
jgi:hypothetical protein